MKKGGITTGHAGESSLSVGKAHFFLLERQSRRVVPYLLSWILAPDRMVRRVDTDIRCPPSLCMCDVHVCPSCDAIVAFPSIL